MKKAFRIVLSLGIVFASFFPVVVHADDATYYEFSAFECFSWYKTSSSGSYYQEFNLPGRAVIIRNGDGYYVWYCVLPADNSSSYYYLSGSYSDSSFSCPTPTSTRSTNITVNNQKYFIFYRDPGSNSIPNGGYFIPIVISSETLSSSSSAMYQKAVYYTYGDGAVSPEPLITYGRPSNVSYSSKIAGKGNAAGENIDRITWDSIRDTNGNELPSGARVQIRAIPGKYTGTNRLDLMSKTYADLVLNYTNALQLADLTADRGFYETKWSEVVGHFSNQIGLPFSPFGYVVAGDSYWYADGWVYEIRLQIDDYFSDWVKVYSATAAGPEVSDQIGNSVSMDVTLINNINTINQLNGVTENWYINNTTINMQPYEEPEEGDKPWWAYLLEAILSLVDSVVDGISSIITHIVDAVSDLIQGILDLFTFDSFTINNYDQEVQDIKDNSGIFGQSLNFVESLQDTFSGAEYAEPVLHYDGITIDDVQIIPAVDVNLNDYVEELGFENFRSVAYMVTDGTIFLSLILLVSHKLTSFLRR